MGITASLGLAVATAVLLLGSNDGFVPMLSLLGNYLFGYRGVLARPGGRCGRGGSRRLRPGVECRPAQQSADRDLRERPRTKARDADDPRGPGWR